MPSNSPCNPGRSWKCYCPFCLLLEPYSWASMLHLCSPGLRALCMRQTLYKLKIIPSPWLTGSKVCSRFHLLSFWAFPLSFCSFQPSHYWPYLWVPVDLWIFLWISGSVNLKLLQLNRSVMLAPNSASLSRLQLQFPDTSLFLLVCFDPCLSSTSGSGPLAYRNR